MKSKLSFGLRKKQFIGLSILGILVLIAETGFYFYKKYKLEQPVSDISFQNISKPPDHIILIEFDPNDLDLSQWIKLGFTEKQAKIILNYKEKKCNGNFSSQEQLAQCFAISPEKFKQLQAYILLPEKKEINNDITYNNPKKSNILNINGKFNPDKLSAHEWQKIGFSERQAEAILKYKNYLGGSFKSKEKFKECFIINEAHYKQLSPFLLLPDKDNSISAPVHNKPIKSKINYTYFDPNTFEVTDWINFGFSENQANAILNYKSKILKGNFKTPEDLQKCYIISSEKWEEIKPWIRIIPQKITTPEASTKTDFSQTDLNNITFKQLIEFGYSEKQAAGFISFRKKLGGFVTKNQIQDTYFSDAELAKRLADICSLDNSKVEKFDLVTVDEGTLKNHPYFHYYADRIIFYRLTYPTEKEIWKRVKPKANDLEKMKLYLK